MLTNAKGNIEERRSYDPFGRRRHPIWGQPPPASFTSKTNKGFTGHEEDDELGLVNAKGRVYDPKLGRFLTTDPIVSRPHFSQSWNSFSYVLNNPLKYVDPFGFQEDDGKDHRPAPAKTYIVQYPDGTLGHLGIVQPLDEEPEDEDEDDPTVAVEVGASAPPTDVDTTGSSAGYEPQAAATAPEDWTQNPYVQLEGGFLGGLSLGLVPFGGVGQQLLDAADVLPHGTPEARRGLAVGQIVGGLISMVGGVTGSVLGGLASTTGIGAALGVPAVAVSVPVVLGGASNVAAGIWGLAQAMMSSGSGSSGPQAATPTAGSNTKDINTLIKAAQKEFPGKAGKIEQHHITPKYLGGDPKGPTVPIDAAYHQKITNEFRKYVPYGSPKPGPAQLQRIMKKVYDEFPLPEGG